MCNGGYRRISVWWAGTQHIVYFRKIHLLGKVMHRAQVPIVNRVEGSADNTDQSSQPTIRSNADRSRSNLAFTHYDILLRCKSF